MVNVIGYPRHDQAASNERHWPCMVALVNWNVLQSISQYIETADTKRGTMNQEPNGDVYDDEAFIGVEEGLITDGKVLDDLDAEGSFHNQCPWASDSRQPARLHQRVCTK